MEYYTLANGLRVVLSPDRTAPIATVGVYYRVGSRTEPRGRTGFAHLFEHMMFQGSPNLPKFQFDLLVQSNGGTVPNGTTQADFTNYFETVPAHALEPVLWGEADRMRALLLTEENLVNQRDVVKSEIRVNVLNEPYGGFPWLVLPQVAFENYPNAHDPYGDFTELDAATLDDLKLFFERYYAPNNAALAVVGDIDVERTKDWIGKYFGDIPRAVVPAAPDVSEPRQEREKRLTKVYPLAPRPAFAVGYQAPDRESPEYFAVGLIDQILGEGKDSRLHRRLVQEMGVTGELSTYLNPWGGTMFNLDGPTLYVIELQHDERTAPDEILRVIDEEVARLQEEPVDSATLERAKRKMRSSFYDLLDRGSGFGRADLLASHALLFDDPAAVNENPPALRGDQPRGDPADGAGVPARHESHHADRRAGRRTMKRPGPVLAIAALLATALFPPGSASTQEPPPPAGPPREFTVPPVERLALPNGLDVRLVPYGEVPKAFVRLVVQTGAVDEGADEVALGDLMGKLLDQGTTTRSAEDIALESARTGGALTVDVGVNQVEIDMAVLAEHAPEAVALVADLARNPLLPQTELDRVRSDLLRELAIARSEADRIAERKFLQLLYPDHPYGRPFPAEETVASYTIDQVRRFHARNFAAGRAQLYVVGRFEAVEVRAAIERHLAGWARGGDPTRVAPPPSSRHGIHLIDRPEAVQSTIYMGLPVTPVGQPDHLPLEVTNTLLGGFFSSRITTNIREEKGYTYGPYSEIRPLLGTAHYVQVADVTTEVTGPALKEILDEIRRLQTELPTEEEVRTVRNYLAGDFLLRNSSRTGITDQLAFLDLHGLDEDYLRAYVGRVQATTAKDLQRLAQEYLQPDRMAIVVVGDRSVVLEQLRPYGEVIEEPPPARPAGGARVRISSEPCPAPRSRTPTVGA